MGDGRLSYIRRGGKGIEWQFDSAAVSKWLIARAVRQSGFGDDLDDVPALSLRRLKADTELKEQEARDRFASEHIPVSTFVEALEQTFVGIREPLASIAKEAAPLVAQETNLNVCHRITERAVNNAGGVKGRRACAKHPAFFRAVSVDALVVSTSRRP